MHKMIIYVELHLCRTTTWNNLTRITSSQRQPSLTPIFIWTGAISDLLILTLLGQIETGRKPANLATRCWSLNKIELWWVESACQSTSAISLGRPLIGQTCCSNFPQHDSSNLFSFYFVASNGDAKGKCKISKLNYTFFKGELHRCRH